MSKRKYMMIDLIMLAVLGVFVESVALLVSGNSLFSLQITIVLIALYRWGAVGIVTAVPMALARYLIFVARGVIEWNELLTLWTYLFGSIGLLCTLPLKKNKKNTKKGFVFIFLYCIIAYVGQAIARSVVVALFENDFLDQLLVFLGFGNILATIVTMIVFTIFDNNGGILVEPISYIVEQREEAIRINKELHKGFNCEIKDPNEVEEVQLVEQEEKNSEGSEQ